MSANYPIFAKMLTEQMEDRCQAKLKPLTQQMKLLQAELTGVRWAAKIANGLRVGITMPAFMTANEINHWLFVKMLNVEPADSEMRIAQLRCLVVPEVLKPQTRYEGVEDVVHTPDMLAAEITSGLNDVEIGSWRDVLRVPCDVCGMESPVVCHRCFEYERELLDISVGVLCLQCVKYFETAGIHGFKKSIQILTAK